MSVLSVKVDILKTELKRIHLRKRGLPVKYRIYLSIINVFIAFCLNMNSQGCLCPEVKKLRKLHRHPNANFQSSLNMNEKGNV